MKYNPSAPKQEFTCEVCDQPFMDWPHLALTVSYHTCSVECEAASWKLPKREPQVHISELEADWSMT